MNAITVLWEILQTLGAGCGVAALAIALPEQVRLWRQRRRMRRALRDGMYGAR